MSPEKLPTPVIGTPGGEPVSVKVEETAETPATVRAEAQAQTAQEVGKAQAQTAQESEATLRTESQRKINLIWEVTQALIAISVTAGTLWIAGSLLLREGGDASGVAFLLLSNAFFMIMTSYHTRTNHTRVGGVAKDQEGR